MLVVGLSLAFLIGVVAIAASAANVQDLLYNRLGKLDVALALPVIGATTLLWSANLTATALFAVSWNWLLQGDINSGRIRLASRDVGSRERSLRLPAHCLPEAVAVHPAATSSSSQ